MRKREAIQLAKDFRLGNRNRKAKLISKYRIKPATSPNTGRVKMGIRIDLENNPKDYIAALDDDGSLVFFTGGRVGTKRVLAKDLWDTPKARKEEDVVSTIAMNVLKRDYADGVSAAESTEMEAAEVTEVTVGQAAGAAVGIAVAGGALAARAARNLKTAKVRAAQRKLDREAQRKRDRDTIRKAQDLKDRETIKKSQKKLRSAKTPKQRQRIQDTINKANERIRKRNQSEKVDARKKGFKEKVKKLGYEKLKEESGIIMDRQLIILEKILIGEEKGLINQFNESHDLDINSISILEVKKLFKNFKISIEERTQYQLVAQKTDGTELKSKFYDEENMLADMQQKCEESEEYESTIVIKRIVDTDEEKPEEKPKEVSEAVKVKTPPTSFAPAKYYFSLFPNRQAAVKKLKAAGFDGMGDLTISQKDSTIKVNPNATKFKKAGIRLTDYKRQHKYVMDIIDEATNSIQEKKIAGLVKKAEKSGMPYGILKQVYNRGMAAWKTGHRPGTTPQQWAFARVNSFVTKSSGTWGKADKDLAAKVRARKK